MRPKQEKELKLPESYDWGILCADLGIEARKVGSESVWNLRIDKKSCCLLQIYRLPEVLLSYELCLGRPCLSLAVCVVSHGHASGSNAGG
jgi:hypothetical protein